MDKEFKDKLKESVDKVVESSKKAAVKAGDAIKDFSDKSVIRIEKSQFESKREKQYAKLGLMIAERFIADASASAAASEDEIKEILEKIQEYSKEIKIREENLEKTK